MKLRVAWVLWAALMVGACDDDEVSATEPVPSAPLAVSVTGGEVRIERGGVLLLPGSGVVPGDVLVTGEGGGARLTLPDGREVEVGSNARVVVGGESQRLVLEVGRGVVLARIAEGQQAASGGLVVELKTPFGLTRLGGGDEAQVDGATGRVEVRRGSIAFVSSDGAVLEVAQGQEVVPGADGAAVARAVAPVEVAPGAAPRADDAATGVPPVEMTLRTREVVLRPSRGTQVREKGSARWKATGRGDVVLAAGDAVRTQKDEATLAVGGLGVTLVPGGELAVEEPASTDAPATLTLTRGALTVVSNGTQAGGLSIDGMTLQPMEAGSAQVRRSDKGLVFDVVAGTFALARGADRRELTGGTIATVSSEGVIAASAREAPPLLLPSVGNQRVLHRDLEAFAAAWDHKGPVRVEVASDSAFRKVILNGRVDTGFVALAPPSRGALHWRVRDLEGKEVARGSADFAPERTARSGSARNNEVPEGAQRTTVYFQSLPPQLTFLYAAQEGAASYLVKVYREGELEKPVVERTVAKPRLTLEPGVLEEGSYLWAATPVDAEGKALRGARMSRLELAYDNAVPDLVVESPAQGARVREGQEVRVAGVAPVGSRVKINGKPIAPDAKGRFSGRARPTGSPACIIFELSRPGVPDTYTVRTLRTRT